MSENVICLNFQDVTNLDRLIGLWMDMIRDCERPMKLHPNIPQMFWIKIGNQLNVQVSLTPCISSPRIWSWLIKFGCPVLLEINGVLLVQPYLGRYILIFQLRSLERLFAVNNVNLSLIVFSTQWFVYDSSYLIYALVCPAGCWKQCGQYFKNEESKTNWVTPLPPRDLWKTLFWISCSFFKFCPFSIYIINMKQH